MAGVNWFSSQCYSSHSSINVTTEGLLYSIEGLPAGTWQDTDIGLAYWSQKINQACSLPAQYQLFGEYNYIQQLERYIQRLFSLTPLQSPLMIRLLLAPGANYVYKGKYLGFSFTLRI